MKKITYYFNMSEIITADITKLEVNAIVNAEGIKNSQTELLEKLDYENQD